MFVFVNGRLKIIKKSLKIFEFTRMCKDVPANRLFLLRESLVLVTGLVLVHNFEIGSVRAVGSPLDILRSRKQPHSREQPQSREYLPSWISIALEPDRPVEAGRLVVISPWTVASFAEATVNPLQTGLLKKTWNTRMRLK